METIDLIQLKKTKSEFNKVKITAVAESYDFIKQFYGDDLEIFESVFILMLDKNNNTIGYSKISQGGVAGSVVDIKIICKYAIDSFASGVILAHNHPSGSLKPSSQDLNITKRVAEALKVFDVTLLDHLIITSESYFSFAENDIINH